LYYAEEKKPVQTASTHKFVSRFSLLSGLGIQAVAAELRGRGMSLRSVLSAQTYEQDTKKDEQMMPRQAYARTLDAAHCSGQ